MEFPCFGIMLEFYLAKDASGLIRMIWAKKALTVVCVQWRAILNKTMEAWRLLHPQLGTALNACTALETRSMTNSRDQAIDVWHPRRLPIDKESFKCGLKCCNKKVGPRLPVCPRVGGAWASVAWASVHNARPDIYGHSDYVYPASQAGQAYPDISCHRSNIVGALLAMQRIAGDLYAWNRNDLTGYVCPAVLVEELEHRRPDTWNVKGVSVACSIECYKISKLMTRDRSSDHFRAQYGLQNVSREFWVDGVYLCLRGVEL